MMNRARLSLSLIMLCLVAAGCSEAAAPEQAEQVAAANPQQPSLAELADGDHRSEANKARNRYRHPVETLQWYGLEPDMTVVEIWPSGGWYAEIIAPYVADQGQYVAAVFNLDSALPFKETRAGRLQKRFADNPELYGQPRFVELSPPDSNKIGPPGSADMVLTFRNLHNWMSRGTTDAMFRSFYEVLKPGGILGVVEHRANTDEPQDPKAESGYVRQDYTIALAEKAGFELLDSTEINANPQDSADHPEGVWTLPPSLRLGEEDREKYLAIGESDRMTLKFVKPE